MKGKITITFIAGFAIASLFAFTGASLYDLKKNTAEVEQEQGLYIFIRSKPVKEYEFLGKVNMPGLVMSGKPKEMMNLGITRCLKQFPEANAIIFNSEDFSKVEAIKIKD